LVVLAGGSGVLALRAKCTAPVCASTMIAALAVSFSSSSDVADAALATTIAASDVMAQRAAVRLTLTSSAAVQIVSDRIFRPIQP
jgi:hypothetical protein